MQGELAGLDRDQRRTGADVPAGAAAGLEDDWWMTPLAAGERLAQDQRGPALGEHLGPQRDRQNWP
jgi:hypothetical protein